LLDLRALAGRGGQARGAAPRCKRIHAAAAVARNDTPGGVTMPTTTARVLTAMLPFLVGASVAFVLKAVGA
jgi:hypothetical protein